MIRNPALLERLKAGNAAYLSAQANPGDVSPSIRKDTSVNGQHPDFIVVTCSDSRVIPEAIFSAGIGEMFVIRVAGNVIGEHELGSIEYAAGHLGSKLILVLGHTGCGAVAAALHGGGEDFIQSLTDEILSAIGSETDARKACCLNVEHSVGVIQEKLVDAGLIAADTDVIGAVYEIADGRINWL